jgi:putative RNA 2'-phosphotransferase
MTTQDRIERITRSLAFMLRHRPEEFDLEVDSHGFADMGDVIRALNERLGEPVEEADVLDAIEAGDRPRYEVVGDRIRALYGHSIPVEPGPDSQPPEFLYLGIPTRDVERAKRYGLRARRRSFLHLALTPADAAETGRRAAREYTVLEIRALDAWEDGVNFYDRTALWLADEIPAEMVEIGDQFTDGIEPHGRPARGGRDEGDERRGRGRERGRRDEGRSAPAARAPERDEARDEDRDERDDHGGGAFDERPAPATSGESEGGGREGGRRRRRRRGGRGRRDEGAEAPATRGAASDDDGDHDPEHDVRDDRHDDRHDDRRAPERAPEAGRARRDERPPRGDERAPRAGRPAREERDERPRRDDRPVEAERGRSRRDEPRDDRPRRDEPRRDEPRRDDDRPRREEQRRDERPFESERSRGRDERPRRDDDRPARGDERAPRRDDRPRDDRPRRDERPPRPERVDEPRRAPAAREDDAGGFGLGVFEAPREPRREAPRPAPPPRPAPRREEPAPQRDDGPAFGAGL